MKIIFLDFDGVLNSMEFMKAAPVSGRNDICIHEDVDPEAIDILNRIIDVTGAMIVISSSWRIVRTIPELQDILSHHGVDRSRIIGVTPSLGTGCRGDEIKFYLNTFRIADDEIESFVILDDGDDMGSVGHRLIRTDFKVGLKDYHISHAVQQLMTPFEESETDDN